MIGKTAWRVALTLAVLDRVTRGSVVDFLNVGVGPVRTGVFNVADVAIMVGAGVMVMATFGKKQQSSPHAPATRPNTACSRPRLVKS